MDIVRSRGEATVVVQYVGVTEGLAHMLLGAHFRSQFVAGFINKL